MTTSKKKNTEENVEKCTTTDETTFEDAVDPLDVPQNTLRRPPKQQHSSSNQIPKEAQTQTAAARRLLRECIM